MLHDGSSQQGKGKWCLGTKKPPKHDVQGRHSTHNIRILGREAAPKTQHQYGKETGSKERESAKSVPAAMMGYLQKHDLLGALRWAAGRRCDVMIGREQHPAGLDRY